MNNTVLKNKLVTIERGDIVMADLGCLIGCIQRGVRPYVVLQNNTGNHFSPTTILAPLSGQLKHEHLPVHVPVTSADLEHGVLKTESMVLLEQIIVADKGCLIDKIGKINAETMRKCINPAIMTSLALVE